MVMQLEYLENILERLEHLYKPPKVEKKKFQKQIFLTKITRRTLE